MRPLGWIEVQTRAVAARFKKDPAAAWLRWARASHHGDVALACLDRAVALGDADAIFEHGLLEREGVFGAAEPAGSFRRAARQGHEEAAVRLAECLRFGPGRERDADEALSWLRRGAESGYRPAAEALAKWMEEQGDPEAAAWQARAASLPPRSLRAGLLKPLESRDPVVRAQAKLAVTTARGFEALVRQPWAPPFFTFVLIVAGLALLIGFIAGTVMTFGLPVIAIALYHLFFGRRQRHTWRFRRMVDAAEAGDAEAAFQLGSDYLQGLPGCAPDALSAGVWFRRAAERGHKGAMAALALALRTGHGLRRDPEEADAWQAAAAAGNR